MQFAGIVLFSIAAAIFYGIAHDQITARVCVEYFTIGHLPVFKTTSPTLLALGWGVLATWWLGCHWESAWRARRGWERGRDWSFAIWFAHTASCAVGALGALSLCLWTLRKRRSGIKNK